VHALGLERVREPYIKHIGGAPRSGKCGCEGKIGLHARST
jgi:hypothetical protein